MRDFCADAVFSRERIRKQVIKYGSIYLAVEFVLVLWTHLSDLINYGSFSFIGLAVNFFKCFVIRSVLMK